MRNARIRRPDCALSQQAALAARLASRDWAILHTCTGNQDNPKISSTMGHGSVRQGDVFWLAPESLRPCVAGVPHPHVVIQNDFINHSRLPTTVVCGITSNQKRANEPGNVLLEPGEAGLPYPSVVIVSQVCLVEKAELTEPLGSLSTERVRQIIEGMLFQQKSFFNR